MCYIINTLWEVVNNTCCFLKMMHENLTCLPKPAIHLMGGGKEHMLLPKNEVWLAFQSPSLRPFQYPWNLVQAGLSDRLPQAPVEPNMSCYMLNCTGNCQGVHCLPVLWDFPEASLWGLFPWWSDSKKIFSPFTPKCKKYILPTFLKRNVWVR